METLESLAIRVEQQSGEIKINRQLLTEIRNLLRERNTESNLILGRFQPGEQIRMCDTRLFEGDGAPFRSYQQVLHAKRRGCPFHRPDNVRLWTITAEDLETWLNAPKQPKLINLV